MTNRQRFEELMEGQDPATVWRDRAFKLAAELDALSASTAPAAVREAAEPFRRLLSTIEALWRADRFTDDAPVYKMLPDPRITVGDLRKLVAALAVPGDQQPINMLVSRDWLREKIASDPDIEDGEARPARAATGGEAVQIYRWRFVDTGAKWSDWFLGSLPDSDDIETETRTLYARPAPSTGASAVEADQHLAAVAIASSIGGEEGWAWLRRYGGGETECVEAARAFDGRAFPAPSTGASVGVKVRALDWSEQNCGHATTWRAESSFGRYLVYMNPDNSWAFEPPGRFGGKIGFKSPNKAMAAAQSDFETRIRAALEGKS